MDSNKAFWVMAIVSVFLYVSDRVLFVIFPNYLLDKNFSATQIGLIFSIASFMLLISRSLIGKLSNTIGRKTIISLGYFLESLSILAYPFITKFYQFSLVKGLQETSATLSESVKDALMADLFKKRVRAKLIRKLGNSIPLSKAFAMLVGFVVTTYFSLVTGFYVASFSLFIASLLLFFFVEESKQKHNNQLKIKLSLRNYPEIFKLMIVIGFLQAVVFTMAYFPGFFILARNIKIAENLLFLMLFAVYVSGGILIFFTKKLVDDTNKLKLTLVSIGAFSFFILLYSFSKSFLSFFAILFFVHLFYAYFWIGFKTVLLDSATKKSRGEQLGFYKTIEGVGNLIGPAIGGFLIDTISLQSVFLLSGTLGLFTVIFAVVLNKKLI